MHHIVSAASDVELAAIWTPGDAVKSLSVLEDDDLLLDRSLGIGDIENENVLSGILGLIVSAQVEVRIVAAGQDEQGIAVGADGGGFGAVRRIVRIIGKNDFKRLENRPRCGTRRNGCACGQNLRVSCDHGSDSQCGGETRSAKEATDVHCFVLGY